MTSGGGGTPVADLGPLEAAPPDLWPALREAFRRAGFASDVLRQGEEILPAQAEQLRVPLVRRALLERGERGDLGADLAALLVYGAPLPRARIFRALGAELPERLTTAGVLRAAPAAAAAADALGAELRVTPFDDVWILSDDLWRDGDPVMGPSMTTDTLRRALPANAVEGRTLLDVGCGAGSLAIWAAARGARAVAVDLSPRAVALTRINALLNGVACEVAAGDLTAPVRGRAFDLVVSQPPFLMRPPEVGAVTFLHGGDTGVELALRLLSEMEGVLAPGGRGLVLFDAAVEKTPIARRIMTAVAPRGPVGLVASIGGHVGPDMVALQTAGASHRHADAAYEAKATLYREHLAARGIARVTHVLADVRRLAPGAASFEATVSWSRLVDLGAAHLDAAWRAVELLGRGPDALLTARLRLADGATLRAEQALVGDEAPTFTLAFGGGAVQDQRLDEQSAAVVRALAARGTVAGACEDLAEPGEAADLHAAVLDFVRRMLLQGALVVG